VYYTQIQYVCSQLECLHQKESSPSLGGRLKALQGIDKM